MKNIDTAEKIANLLEQILHELRSQKNDRAEEFGQILSELQSPVPKREYLTVQEVAKYLGKSTKTIRNWISERRLPAKKIGNGGEKDRIYIRRTHVDELLERGSMKST